MSELLKCLECGSENIYVAKELPFGVKGTGIYCNDCKYTEIISNRSVKEKKGIKNKEHKLVILIVLMVAIIGAFIIDPNKEVHFEYLLLAIGLTIYFGIHYLIRVENKQGEKERDIVRRNNNNQSNNNKETD